MYRKCSGCTLEELRDLLTKVNNILMEQVRKDVGNIEAIKKMSDVNEAGSTRFTGRSK